MKSQIKFFYCFLVTHFIGLLLMVKMITEGIEYYGNDTKDFNDIYFLGFYMFILTFQEYASVARYCFMFSMSGIVQLIPLKIYHYLFVLGTMIDINVKYYRFSYIALDILLCLYFIHLKDSTVSEIFKEYNKTIGADINVRNSFMVS